MMRRLAGILLPALIAACHAQGENSVRVTVIGEPAALFRAAPILPLPARLVRAATSQGLVAFDAEGHIVPALADRWIVADDGQSYIFRLRSGARGDAANPAEQVRGAIRQAIAAQRGTPLGLELSSIDEVRAMAGRVIEIRLSRPTPDLLQLLAQPELGLRKGKDTGPMTLRREGMTVVLTPLPPERRGLPAVDGWSGQARAVRLGAGPAAAALADFAAGRVDFVFGGTFADYPRLSRFALGRGRPRFDTVTGLFGFQVVREQGLLATPQLREALAMAIDRDALAAALGARGWTTTTRVIPPGAEGDPGMVGERWQGMPIAQRQAAAARVVAARAPAGPRRLTVALPAGPGADLLFGRLATDFAALGIRLDRAAADAPADLRLLDRIARSARPPWFLAQLSCAAVRGPCSQAADALATDAATTADPAAAASLAAQAEMTLTAANTFIPLGVPLRWSLAPADAPGFAPNRWGVHPLMALATGGA
jgi:peptide/nickel transport system substrate-binding protein/oligopeptide transport system substrate-binding protein